MKEMDFIAARNILKKNLTSEKKGEGSRLFFENKINI